MQVVLKVLGGKNDGRIIPIAVPRFIIGRGSTAHLRPASDLISREHCAIEVANGEVKIVDLGSSNGTFVNGNPLTGTHVAKAGDSLKVGRLEFEVGIDLAIAGAKRPKVKSVVEAASRTASTKKESLEDSISDWLLDTEDEEVDMDDDEVKQVADIIATSDTVMLNLDDTTAISKAKADDQAAEAKKKLDEVAEELAASKKSRFKKSKPMKLPPIPKTQQHDNSTSAADDVLKKFFNRR